MKESSSKRGPGSFAPGVLTELQQNVLHFCAIFYEPVSEMELLKALQDSKVLDESGHGVTFRTLNEALSVLRSRGWLPHSGSVVCDEKRSEEAIVNASQSPNFKQFIQSVRAIRPLPKYRNWYSTDLQRNIREIRLSIFEPNPQEFYQLLTRTEQEYRHQFEKDGVLAYVFDRPFAPKLLKNLSISIQRSILWDLVPQRVSALKPVEDVLEFLSEFVNVNDKEGRRESYRVLAADLLILQGKLNEAAQIIRENSRALMAAWQLAGIDFLEGRNEQSLGGFAAALKDFRKSYHKEPCPANFSGLLYLLARIKTNDFNHLAEVEKAAKKIGAKRHLHAACFQAVESFTRGKRNNTDEAAAMLLAGNHEEMGALTLWIRALVIHWLYPEQLATLKRPLIEAYQLAYKNGYGWIAMEYAALLSTIPQCAESFAKNTAALASKLGMSPLVNMVPHEEEWERALKSLAALDFGGEKGVDVNVWRVIWLVDFERRSITLKEQKRRETGWTKGRMVSALRLKNGQVQGMTQQDHLIAGAFEATTYGWHTVQFEKAILAMVGHPFVYLEDSPGVQVEIVRGQPSLSVERKDDHYDVSFSAQDDTSRVQIVRETPTRYRAIELQDTHQQIARILRGKKLKVPHTADEILTRTVGHLSSVVTVHSAVEVGQESIPAVDADARCFVHLLPHGAGFRLELFVKPLGEKGPYLSPGTGSHNILAEVEGRKVQSRRDLPKEKENLRQILDACASLTADGNETGPWEFENPEECLQILLELNTLREHVPVEWPEGGLLKVSSLISFDQLKLRIKKENDWFSVNGELNVDDSLVLDMRRLLELIESHKGRFIPIGDNQFLALTDSFRKSLEEMRAASEIRGKGARFHPLAAPGFRDLLFEIKNVETDDLWREHLEKIDRAQSFEPQIPSTLQAELRDYQGQGFRWMAQLAHWGAGACLADDMGLGKTVQALAIILDRARNGPTLAVCPASVTFNWVQEAHRFAPTLNVKSFAGKERSGVVKDLKPFDLLVCSYTLLHNEAELLSSLSWATIVLDEAQAIKNVFTRRTQAAMNLKGDFKIITTGTPIENHLGELWSLFNFINPGLLGSHQRFNERFALPIEKHKDAAARRHLKRLIQPFVLRRLKSEVLEELPPKTEITLNVEMTAEEAAFYEALRRISLERLENQNGPPGEKHLRILAEIMKLRRACCHTRLVQPDSRIESSKLKAFGEIVDELLENRHKALVFSQFVDYLHIIRAFVQERGIPYQYLDGSTPIKEREKRVAAFQAGEGELFLISLRAGGQGLNLTAADYVIHMDPWWNPAVEDQASDRVHRIGQQHPVTIYRLVAGSSIEEKIVLLHSEKRDLADSLLEGADTAAKMNAEQLLAMIREL